MEISTALREARKRAGLGLDAFGRQVGYSKQMLSMVEHEHREMAPDVARASARLLDDPDLYLAVAARAADGVLVPVVLDGPRVDLHRLATGAKATEEFAEAIERLAKCRAMINGRTAEDLDDEGRSQVQEVLHHVAEAVTAGGNTVRVLCLTYGISPRQVWAAHVAELVSKGLAQPRREASRVAKSA